MIDYEGNIVMLVVFPLSHIVQKHQLNLSSVHTAMTNTDLFVSLYGLWVGN